MKTKKSRVGKIIGTIVILLFVAVVVAVIAAGVWYKSSLTAINSEKCVGETCETAEFVIVEGESSSVIAQRLEEQGLIKSALAFRIYMKLDGSDSALKVGTYNLSKDMSVAEIVESFNKGSLAKTFRITFLPGGTVADAKARLAKVGYSDEQISAAFSKKYDHPLLKDLPEGDGLEGYIYGETYEFYATASVEDILTRVFDEMYKVVQENGLEQKYKAQGLNLHQGITLASVVQSEAGIMSEKDQRQVAQVFLLRLKRGIVLGSDAIIAYRANQLNPNRSKSDMSYLTSMTCPWNSRKCKGLPPTPISNPGATALKAVGNPAKGDYIYFISGYDDPSKKDKLRMFYARTEAEHNANIRNHCGDLCYVL